MSDEYKRVTKVQARDGSLHDTTEDAQQHDALRAQLARIEEAERAIYGLVANHDFWSIESHLRELEDYEVQAFREDVANFVIKNWPELSPFVVVARERL